MKILDNKIRQNQADYYLYRKNAKISALISGKLDKCEYFSGEDLGYKPDAVQKVKFEYSPLGQVFNKGLTTDEKQEGLLKRLQNIEDKTDNQLDLIRDQGDKQLDTINKITSEKIDGVKIFSEKSKRLGDEIRKKIKENDDKKYTYTATDNTSFNFRKYDLILMGYRFFTRDLTLDKAKQEQKKIDDLKKELIL